MLVVGCKYGGALAVKSGGRVGESVKTFEGGRGLTAHAAGMSPMTVRATTDGYTDCGKPAFPEFGSERELRGPRSDVGH